MQGTSPALTAQMTDDVELTAVELTDVEVARPGGGDDRLVCHKHV